jgi:hypothetical protein
VGKLRVCVVQLLNIRSIKEHFKSLHFLVKGYKVGKIMVRHYYQMP